MDDAIACNLFFATSSVLAKKTVASATHKTGVAAAGSNIINTHKIELRKDFSYKENVGEEMLTKFVERRGNRIHLKKVAFQPLANIKEILHMPQHVSEV